jgi:dihydrofolate reductase
MTISLIVAKAKNNVIGKDNQLIWHLPADLKFFKNKTMGHTVVMGRKTYDSMGKPLPGRMNVVITRQQNFHPEGVTIEPSLESALEDLKVAEVFIIGGGEIFKHAMPLADKMYVTEIDELFDGDVYFPEINPDEWELTEAIPFPKDEKNKYNLSFNTYIRRTK